MTVLDKVSDSEGCEDETNNAKQSEGGANSSQDTEKKNNELTSEDIPPQGSSQDAAVNKESSEFEVVEPGEDTEAVEGDDM